MDVERGGTPEGQAATTGCDADNSLRLSRRSEGAPRQAHHTPAGLEDGDPHRPLATAADTADNLSGVHSPVSALNLVRDRFGRLMDLLRSRSFSDNLLVRPVACLR